MRLASTKVLNTDGYALAAWPRYRTSLTRAFLQTTISKKPPRPKAGSARSEGLEPSTFGAEIRRSIQLNYERRLLK